MGLSLISRVTIVRFFVYILDIECIKEINYALAYGKIKYIY